MLSGSLLDQFGCPVIEAHAAIRIALDGRGTIALCGDQFRRSSPPKTKRFSAGREWLWSSRRSGEGVNVFSKDFVDLLGGSDCRVFRVFRQHVRAVAAVEQVLASSTVEQVVPFAAD